MNILVKPYGSRHCYCRPDTTWERENRDLYVPEGVRQLHWAPVVFVRISKAGKCIGRKFASRYYDAVNFGALLYCVEDSGQIAYSSCADHTSLLPSPMHGTEVLDDMENTFEMKKNDEVIFRQGVEGLSEEIEEAICQASKMTSVRIGDYLAVELAHAECLSSEDDGLQTISATFCDSGLFGMKLVF